MARTSPMVTWELHQWSRLEIRLNALSLFNLFTKTFHRFVEWEKLFIQNHKMDAPSILNQKIMLIYFFIMRLALFILKYFSLSSKKIMVSDIRYLERIHDWLSFTPSLIFDVSVLGFWYLWFKDELLRSAEPP